MFRFSLFGFPVQVQWYFWLSCALLGGGFYAKTADDWIGVAIWTAVVFVSIIVHELGHAFLGRRYGAKPFIILHGLGGLAIMPGLQVNRWQSIAVSLAGPFAGFILGGIVFALAPILPLEGAFARQTLHYLLFVNIFWGIFNLLPVLPMDGGQALRAFLGPDRLKITLWIGTVTAIILTLLALLIHQWFIAVFLGFLAYSNWKNQSIPGGTVQG